MGLLEKIEGLLGLAPVSVISTLNNELIQSEAANAVSTKTIADLEAQLESSNAVAESCKTNMNLSQSNLQDQINALTTQLATAGQQLASANSALANAGKLSNPISLLPESEQDSISAIWNSYKEANVTYEGRYIGNESNPLTLDCKEWAWNSQRNSALVNWVADNRASVEDVLQDNPGISIHRAWDIAAMRCGVWTIMYGSDTYDGWLDSEFWMFACETWFSKCTVCHGMAIVRYVLMRIAGIPAEVLKIKVGGCGVIFNGVPEGHSTNYYLASDMQWHLINSTTVYGFGIDVLKQPLETDISEQMNILQDWFTFNEDKTWREANLTTASKAALKDQPFFQNLKFPNL